MKVFLSWSGSRSKAVAELLNMWIPCVLQSVTPWMSSKHIDRGAIWFSEIADQLNDTTLGIICLTQENKNKPWILFEAGSLAKGLNSARVCTILVDLMHTDILANPLAQFNHTIPTKDGIWQLIQTLNSTLGEKGLSLDLLERVFNTYWPQFESGFGHALELNASNTTEQPRTAESMVPEILETVRTIQKQMRDLEMQSDNAAEQNLVGLQRAAAMRHPSIPYDIMNEAITEAYEKLTKEPARIMRETPI